MLVGVQTRKKKDLRRRDNQQCATFQIISRIKTEKGE